MTKGKGEDVIIISDTITNRVPGPVLNTTCAFSSVILTTTLGDGSYLETHFLDDETGTVRLITQPGSSGVRT